ncbi:MAG TPA: thiol:disulfide interchange protein DsbA/DsbL [Woeseiaceae bacterium]|nr:thiol:disulfide interchange protein DsbA/DsbL [Woeseiaceae bacterium]
MKHLLILGAFFGFALAGCDSGPEPAAPATDSAAPAEQQPAAEAPASGEAPDEADAGEPQVVEESASVTDDLQPDEQPLTLARSDTSEAPGDWKYQEGEQFERLVPTQPTVGGADKIEVAEVFWYGCPHCLAFEPYVNRWAEQAPANVRFVRIPAVWNPLVKLHAQLYYAEQVLVENGAIEKPKEFRAAVFDAYHHRGNRLASEEAIQEFFVNHGVTAEQFQSAWSSFEVAQKLRVAEDLARRYNISSVPAMVVNGKYRTGPQQAGGLQEMIDVVKELVARETAR